MRRAPARRRADGLPHAGPERRRGDARRARGCPATRVVCLTASVTQSRDRRAARRGRGRLRHEGRGLRQHRRAPSRRRRRPHEPHRREHRGRARLDRRLPRRAGRFPNFRVVPLYVRFGDESYRDYVDIEPGRVLRAPRDRDRAADDVAADTRRLPRGVRGARAAVRADPLAADLLDALRHVRERAGRGRAARRRQRARDRHAHGLGGDRDARDRRPASGSSAARPTRRSTRSSSATRRSTSCSSPSTRSSTSRRAAASVALPRSPGNLLNVKPILTIRDGEVVPLKRVRGNHKAFAEFRELFESTTTDSPNLKVGIAHAAAPERLAGAARARRARAAAGADRDRDDARRRRRHARRAGHGRLLLVRRRRSLSDGVRSGSYTRSRWRR